MPKLKEIIEELQFLSDRISTQVRTIAVSLIALVWAISLDATSSQIGLTVSAKRELVLIGVLALLAMVFDYLQYFLGFVYTNALRNEIESQDKEEGQYNYRDWRYRLRNGLFCMKQIVLLAAVVWLVLVAKGIAGPLFTNA